MPSSKLSTVARLESLAGRRTHAHGAHGAQWARSHLSMSESMEAKLWATLSCAAREKFPGPVKVQEGAG